VRNSIGFSYPTRLEFGRRSRGGIDTTLLWTFFFLSLSTTLNTTTTPFSSTPAQPFCFFFRCTYWLDTLGEIALAPFLSQPPTSYTHTFVFAFVQSRKRSRNLFRFYFSTRPTCLKVSRATG
jgi:hypothetical protein